MEELGSHGAVSGAAGGSAAASSSAMQSDDPPKLAQSRLPFQSTAPLCQLCEGVAATWLCEDCEGNRFMCKMCTKTHDELMENHQARKLTAADVSPPE